MSHSIDTSTQSPPSTGTDSTSDIAKDQARNVGQSAATAGSQVASTAADQAKQVTAETKQQAADLLSQGRSQLEDQARTGQQRASQGLTDIAGQLRGMVDGGGEAPSGPAADLVRQAGERADQLAGWLADREPGDILQEVRAYARRKPGTFLLGAAVAGIVAGRLTTGIVGAHKDASASDTDSGPLPSSPPRHALDAGSNYAADSTVAGYSTGDLPPAQAAVPPLPYGVGSADDLLAEPAHPASWQDSTPTSGEGRL